MLPAQDDKRQLDSVSAVADNWETSYGSNVIEETATLGQHLETAHLDSIERANRELERIAEHVKSLEHLLGTINELNGAQDKINAGKALGYPEVAHFNLDRETDVSLDHTVPSSVHLIGVGAPQASAEIGAPLPAPRSFKEPVIPLTEVELPAAASTLFDEDTATLDTIALDDETVRAHASNDEILTQAVPNHFLPALKSETSVQPLTEASEDNNKDFPESTPLTDEPSFVISAVSANGVNGEASDSTKTSSQQAGEFDTKLLDDLIKNYGEFAANPNLPVTTQPSETRWPERKSQSNTDEVRTQTSPDRNTTRNSNDLDRELKKLIQDYGEYDLYSQGGTLKAKLRVGGAFAVLVAVLGGIYYFASPKTSSEPVPNVISESQPAEKLERSNDALSTPVKASDSTTGTDVHFVPPHTVKGKKK